MINPCKQFFANDFEIFNHRVCNGKSAVNFRILLVRIFPKYILYCTHKYVAVYVYMCVQWRYLHMSQYEHTQHKHTQRQDIFKWNDLSSTPLFDTIYISCNMIKKTMLPFRRSNRYTLIHNNNWLYRPDLPTIG